MTGTGGGDWRSLQVRDFTRRSSELQDNGVGLGLSGALINESIENDILDFFAVDAAGDEGMPAPSASAAGIIIHSIIGTAVRSQTHTHTGEHETNKISSVGSELLTLARLNTI